jgi:hypothetical protein
MNIGEQLEQAVLHGDVAEVTRLLNLDKGSEDDYYAQHMQAMTRGEVVEVRPLRADEVIYEQLNQAFHGDVARVARLLQEVVHLFDANAGLDDHLKQAAFDGDAAEVARLLDAGADINYVSYTWTPLHAAIENENVACVKLLLERGADIELQGAAGMSPLAHAVDTSIDGTNQRGGGQDDVPTEIVMLLIAAGADIGPGLDVARTYHSQKLIRLLINSMTERTQHGIPNECSA